MTIKQALQFGHNALKDSVPTSLTDSKVLMGFVLDIPREELQLRLHQILTEGQFKKYKKYLSSRQKNTPIAYIVGYKEFFNIPFYVDERVLIPRPETELMVEHAIAELERHPAKKRLLIDIGTGSGNIAISIARNIPLLPVIATDASKQAIDVAKRNARTFETSQQIEFRVGSLLEAITPADIEGAFVVLAANLPYVPKRYNVEPDIHHEPEMAIFGGDEGLELYSQFFTQLKELVPKDLVGFFEIHYDQAEGIKALITKSFPKAKVEIHRDYGGYDRLVELRLGRRGVAQG
jgi:release factor glutamine methyltransferase